MNLGNFRHRRFTLVFNCAEIKMIALPEIITLTDLTLVFAPSSSHWAD